MRGGDAFRRQGDGISAVSGNHPEALLVLIFLEHAGAHGVNDPLAVETDLGLRDIANLEVVVSGDVAGSGGRGLRRGFLSAEGQPGKQNKRRGGKAANAFQAENYSEAQWRWRRG